MWVSIEDVRKRNSGIQKHNVDFFLEMSAGFYTAGQYGRMVKYLILTLSYGILLHISSALCLCFSCVSATFIDCR